MELTRDYLIRLLNVSLASQIILYEQQDPHIRPDKHDPPRTAKEIHLSFTLPWQFTVTGISKILPNDQNLARSRALAYEDALVNLKQLEAYVLAKRKYFVPRYNGEA